MYRSCLLTQIQLPSFIFRRSQSRTPLGTFGVGNTRSRILEPSWVCCCARRRARPWTIARCIGYHVPRHQRGILRRDRMGGGAEMVFGKSWSVGHQVRFLLSGPVSRSNASAATTQEVSGVSLPGSPKASRQSFPGKGCRITTAIAVAKVEFYRTGSSNSGGIVKWEPISMGSQDVLRGAGDPTLLREICQKRNSLPTVATKRRTT